MTRICSKQTLSTDQEKLIGDQSKELTAAREKVQALRQSLQEESARVVTLQGLYDTSSDNLMVCHQTAANLREDITALNATTEKDEAALKEGWVTVTKQTKTQTDADRYQQLWKKSTSSRKLEQDNTQAIMVELAAAQETIARLQSEAHDTSMELDDLNRRSPMEQSPLNSSPAMAFSEIKQTRTDTPAAAPSEAPCSAGSADIYEKEEMIQMYTDTGQVVMTPYFYKGERLELSALLTTMQELHTAFRQEITEFKTHRSLNKYHICIQDWHWPLRKRITKKLRKERVHKESIIKNLDMIIDHMQYKQSNEFGETHGEGSEISEFSKPCKTNYEHGRISTEPNYTESRANPDHPHLTRQGGRTPNSYNEEETNTQLNKEHFKELTFTPACNTKHAAQESSGSLNSHNYWEILRGEDTEKELEHLGG